MKDKEYELISELVESSEKSFKKLFMNYHDTLFRLICYKLKIQDKQILRGRYYPRNLHSGLEFIFERYAYKNYKV